MNEEGIVNREWLKIITSYLFIITCTALHLCFKTICSRRL